MNGGKLNVNILVKS